MKSKALVFILSLYVVEVNASAYMLCDSKSDFYAYTIDRLAVNDSSAIVYMDNGEKSMFQHLGNSNRDAYYTIGKTRYYQRKERGKTQILQIYVNNDNDISAHIYTQDKIGGITTSVDDYKAGIFRCNGSL